MTPEQEFCLSSPRKRALRREYGAGAGIPDGITYEKGPPARKRHRDLGFRRNPVREAPSGATPKEKDPAEARSSSLLCTARLLDASGWKEVAPEQFTVPESAFALEPEAAESELLELFEPPQPTSPRPARATAVPPASERKERRERLSDMLLLPEGVTAPPIPRRVLSICMLWARSPLPSLVCKALRHPDRTLRWAYIWGAEM